MGGARIQPLLGQGTSGRAARANVWPSRAAFFTVPPVRACRHRRQEQPLGQGLGRLPAVEAIAVVSHEEHQFLVPVIEMDLDRGGETPQQGGQGRRGQVDEAEDLLGLVQLQYAGPRPDRLGLPGQAQGQVPPLAVEEPQGQGQV